MERTTCSWKSIKVGQDLVVTENDDLDWSSQCCHLVSYTVVDHLKLLWFMKWCVYYCMYLHFMLFKSFTWSLYQSKAMWRLMAESPAWNAVKTMFFNWIGMGDVTDLEGHLERSFTFVSTYLQPDFILGNHAMSACFSLKYIDVGYYCLYFLPLILLQELEHLVTQIWHIAQSSWEHFLPTSLRHGKEKGRASKARFVPTTACATLLIFLSPPIITPESFSHLFIRSVYLLPYAIVN